MPRLRDLKDALLGKTRRIEELENTLRYCLLSVESARLSDWSTEQEALEIIEEKCKKALDKA